MDGFSPTQSENQGVISGVAQQGPHGFVDIGYCE
jgi:hypothetical protein